MKKLAKTTRKRMELETHLKTIGYTQDRWGHYRKSKNGGTEVRFKMGSISCRFERKVMVCGQSEWRNLIPNTTLYYKDFHLNNGKISFAAEKKGA